MDLLPQKGLQQKITLPLFVGGTLAHLLAVDYSLKPLIHALGGHTILSGVYAIDEWIEKLPTDQYVISKKLEDRLDESIGQLHHYLLKQQQLLPV